MKQVVTGNGGTVVIGFYSNDKFEHVNKFPRKLKKTLKRDKPFLKFPKNNIEFLIKKCVHKDWLKDDHSFALKIVDKPVLDDRNIYFVPYFPETDKVTDKHIVYKRENSEIVINI